MLILTIIVIGMFAGWVAHMITGGGSKLDWPRLFAFGLIGSFIGGTLFSLIAGDGFEIRPSGIIGSIIGATLVTLVARQIGRTA